MSKSKQTSSESALTLNSGAIPSPVERECSRSAWSGVDASKPKEEKAAGSDGQPFQLAERRKLELDTCRELCSLAGGDRIGGDLSEVRVAYSRTGNTEQGVVGDVVHLGPEIQL